MRKTTTFTALALLIGALALPAMADFSGSPMPVQITRHAGFYSGEGGEFTITPGATLAATADAGTFSDFSGAGSWQSFCIERNEYVTLPGSYYADINTFSTQGGVGGHDGYEGPAGQATDTLDPRTAYLYQNFRLGTLASYTYGPSRTTDAGALQNAIWYIEGELSSISGKAVTFYNEAVEATEIGKFYNGTSPDGFASWTGLGRVRVLNMWGDSARTQFQQDQLLLVPVPGAMFLGALGLAGVSWVRRRVA